MTQKIIYNAEFPNGKTEDFTSDEETELTVRAEKSVEDFEKYKAELAKEEADKVSGNQKLKDLGLTDDEISALIG